MSRNIREGDSVVVYFTEGSLIKGVVENTPSDTGDLWYISTGTTIIGLNPQGSEFLYIEKEL